MSRPYDFIQEKQHHVQCLILRHHVGEKRVNNKKKEKSLN